MALDVKDLSLLKNLQLGLGEITRAKCAACGWSYRSGEAHSQSCPLYAAYRGLGEAVAELEGRTLDG